MNAQENRRARSRGTTRGEKLGTEGRRLDWPGDPESLTADAVDFEALAHVLANTCRRGGRLRRFHSLAAHAVLVSEAVEAMSEHGTGDNREAALHALLADAGVAWLAPADDAASQRGAERFKRLRETVDQAVRGAAGLRREPSPEEAELLRFVGRMAEAAEDRDIPGARDGAASAVAFPPLPGRIRTVEPDRAATLWLDRLQELRRPSSAAGGAVAPLAEESGNDSASQDESRATGVQAQRTAGGMDDEA